MSAKAKQKTKRVKFGISALISLLIQKFFISAPVYFSRIMWENNWRLALCKIWKFLRSTHFIMCVYMNCISYQLVYILFFERKQHKITHNATIWRLNGGNTNKIYHKLVKFVKCLELPWKFFITSIDKNSPYEMVRRAYPNHGTLVMLMWWFSFIKTKWNCS